MLALIVVPEAARILKLSLPYRVGACSMVTLRPDCSHTRGVARPIHSVCAIGSVNSTIHLNKVGQTVCDGAT